MKIKQDGNWINLSNFVSGYFGPSMNVPNNAALLIQDEASAFAERIVIHLEGTTISTGTYDTDNQS